MSKQKKWITYVCITAILCSTLIGCSSNKQTTVDKQASPTPKVLVSDEDKNSNLGQWGRNMGSVLIAINEGNVYYFGGYEPTDGNQKAAAAILQKSWNISNRKQLIDQMYDLLHTGSRSTYRKEAAQMRSMSAKELKTAMKQLSGDMKVHYEMIRYNWKTWRKKGLLAWDMCRISHLAQWGYVAGYLTISEAQAVIEPAAKKLKANFTSWDEVQQNWLDGYALYASIDVSAATGTDYEVRKAKYEQLKADDQKNTDTKLYDDTLFTKDIIPVTGSNAASLWKERKSAK